MGCYYDTTLSYLYRPTSGPVCLVKCRWRKTVLYFGGLVGMSSTSPRTAFNLEAFPKDLGAIINQLDLDPDGSAAER